MAEGLTNGEALKSHIKAAARRSHSFTRRIQIGNARIGAEVSGSYLTFVSSLAMILITSFDPFYPTPHQAPGKPHPFPQHQVVSGFRSHRVLYQAKEVGISRGALHFGILEIAGGNSIRVFKRG